MIRPAAPIPLFNFAHRNWRLVIDNHTKPRAVNLELRTIASSNLLTKGVATNFQRAPKIRSKKIEDVRYDQGGRSVRKSQAEDYEQA